MVRKNKKIISAIIVVIALISVLFITVHALGLLDNSQEENVSSDIKPTNTVDYGPPKKEDTVQSPEKSATPDNNSNSSADTSDKNLSVLITRASRSQVAVYIEKISSGTCNLSITQNGLEKISMSSKTLAEREYSTCEGFELDSSKLDSSPFTVKITVNSDDRSGSTTQEVN